MTPFKDNLQSLGNQDLLEMIHEIARRRSKEELKMIIALCWTAWRERNQFVFESKDGDPHFLVAKAEAIVEAYERK